MFCWGLLTGRVAATGGALIDASSSLSSLPRPCLTSTTSQKQLLGYQHCVCPSLITLHAAAAILLSCNASLRVIKQTKKY